MQWTPTPEQVRVHIPVRVAAPFDDDTVPTAAEVVILAELSSEEVLAEVGQVPASLHEMARLAAAYLCAYKLERSFWPEQSEGDGSSARLLRQDYTDALARLRRAVRAGSAGGVGMIPIRPALADVLVGSDE